MVDEKKQLKEPSLRHGKVDPQEAFLETFVGYKESLEAIADALSVLAAIAEKWALKEKIIDEDYLNGTDNGDIPKSE